MQVRRFADWSARSAYYLARLLSQQLAEGEDYSELKPVIGIQLLDFDLFTDYPDTSTWRFALRDHHHSEVALGDEQQLDIVELKKADRLNLTTTPLHEWVRFTEHWQELTDTATIDYEPVRRAMEQLRTLSDDDEARRMAFVRERAIRDEKSLLRQARQEGRMDVARNLIDQTDMTDDQIARATGLTAKQVKALR